MLVPESVVQGGIAGITAAHIFRSYEVQTGLPYVILHLAGALGVFVFCSSFVDFAVTVGVYFLALFGNILAYRYIFHPLKKFPGPALAPASQIWLSRLSLTGKRHERMREFHQKYGDFVRTGPNQLSIATKNAVIPILGPNGFDKGPYYSASWKEPGAENLFSLRTSSVHQPRRKLWDHAFSPKALQGYQPILENDYLSYFMFDFVGDLAYGNVEGFEMMKHGDPNEFWHTLQEAMVATYTLGCLPWFALDVYKFAKFPEKQLAFMTLTKKCFIDRRNSQSKSADVFSWLLGEHDEEMIKKGKQQPNLSDPNLSADSLLLLAAGVDTTLTTLTYIFAYLLSPKYREYYWKLRQEIDDNVKEDPSFLTDPNKLSQAKLLNAVVHEGLRLGTPVPTGSQRVVPPNGVVIDGKYIPEGTQVTMHAWTVHRDSRYYDDPDSFKPERFFDRALDETFLPFSYGPHNCIGKRLAVIEMRQLLANVLYNIDITPGPDFDLTEFENASKEYFLMKAGKVPCVMKKRSM